MRKWQCQFNQFNFKKVSGTYWTGIPFAVMSVSVRLQEHTNSSSASTCKTIASVTVKGASCATKCGWWDMHKFMNRCNVLGKNLKWPLSTKWEWLLIIYANFQMHANSQQHKGLHYNNLVSRKAPVMTCNLWHCRQTQTFNNFIWMN